MATELIGAVRDIPLRRAKSFSTWVGIVLVLITMAVTMRVSEFNVVTAVTVIPGVLKFIFTDFLPPNVRALPPIVNPLLDTIAMAIVSTVTATFISLILALLGAALTTPHTVLRIAIRAGTSFLRNVPALAWTMILVPAFGIGKFVGVLALIIGSLGGMTRFFMEAIEEIDVGKIEAIQATGGSYWQVLRNGVLPQCTPGLVSWTLYSLELDVRASTIIGMVGGGGIGFFIQTSIKLFRYSDAAMAIFVVALLVILIEWTSKKVRQAIL
jgi:phosphonate transport system permease protein